MRTPCGHTYIGNIMCKPVFLILLNLIYFQLLVPQKKCECECWRLSLLFNTGNMSLNGLLEISEKNRGERTMH